MTQEEKSNGAGLTLLTFILGAASGAAVALLYAPQSGKDTREYLAERAARDAIRRPTRPTRPKTTSTRGVRP